MAAGEFGLDGRKMWSSSSLTSIPDLPENCIAHILSLTTPRDVCRSSAVSSTFLLAASSDYVWEKMLPPDIHQLLFRVSQPIHFSSSKELFFSLCSSPLIKDFDRKVPRGSAVAELLDVCWLSISGRISTADLSPSARYAAYFVFKHTNNSYGFDSLPAKLSIRMNDSPHVSEHEAFVHPENAAARGRRFRRRGRRSALWPREGYGEWMEVKVGEFFTDDEGAEVECSLMETGGGHWKSGMLLEGLEIRPTN